MTEHSDEHTDTDTPNSLLQLDAMEARVLGALIEKEHTTPEAYPLTQNALSNACNQKSSREPVMSLSPGEVGHTLRQLENRRLVRSESGSRSERFSQQLSHKLSLNDKRQALICLLLLRGPQTLSELLTRSTRLAEFRDIEDVRLSVLKLIERPQPLVMQLHRQAGQREDRYAHLLSGEPAMPAPSPLTERAPRAEQNQSVVELLARVEQLEQAMVEIQQRLNITVNDGVSRGVADREG